jgi:phosphoglycerol transferase MdoB-like AlkP superfamily enzyme
MSREVKSQASGVDAVGGNVAVRNLMADAALWMAMLLALQGFRALMLWLYRSDMSPDSDAIQIFRCFGTGMRYDIFTASYTILPSLVLTLVSFYRPLGALHRRVRWAIAGVVTVVFVLGFVIDVGYFHEYHDQFDNRIFGLVFDDRKAIAQTVWKTYPVVWLLVMVPLGCVGLIFAGRKVWRAISRRVRPPVALALGPARFITPLLVLILTIFGLRASFGRRPIQLKDAAVTTDPFLNRIVLNPFTALRYAIQHQLMLSAATGLRVFLPDGNVQAAARECFPKAEAVTNLDECLKRSAAGASVRPPRHIFLVCEESYDSWGLRPEFASLHATDRLYALGRGGIAADSFVSAADHTMPSLAALITGLPDAGIHVNYQPGSKKPFPTSIAPIFKRLGYHTRFFYGGYLSWERVGDFARDQGFDEVHGGSEMSDRLTGNEWGVNDEDLFNFVISRLSDEPSFNLIMTTSYHPPFSVDLKAKGFPQKEIQPELDALGFSAQDTKVLGHLWYADKSLGDFVMAELKIFPRSLFAVTADHWSVRAFSTRPILFGQRAVPFVLYGPEILRAVPRPQRIAGSHTDIPPTLVELVAPKGFEYHAFGRNMLDTTQTQIGFGNGAILTPDFILEANSHGAVQDVRGNPANDRVPVDEWRLRYRQLHALSWWLVMKGNVLASNAGNSSHRSASR